MFGAPQGLAVTRDRYHTIAFRGHRIGDADQRAQANIALPKCPRQGRRAVHRDALGIACATQRQRPAIQRMIALPRPDDIKGTFFDHGRRSHFGQPRPSSTIDPHPQAAERADGDWLFAGGQLQPGGSRHQTHRWAIGVDRHQ